MSPMGWQEGVILAANTTIGENVRETLKLDRRLWVPTSLRQIRQIKNVGTTKPWIAAPCVLIVKNARHPSEQVFGDYLMECGLSDDAVAAHELEMRRIYT